MQHANPHRLPSLAPRPTVPVPPPRPLNELRREAARRLATDLVPGWLVGRCDGCGAHSAALAVQLVEGIVCELCPDCVRLGVTP